MKRITSSDLPQADRLESVLLTVIAVGNNAQTDIEIANKIPGIKGDSRQGRYYRNAAQMLGFIVNRRNNASLTSKGVELLNNPVLTNPMFIASVLNLEIYQKLFPFLELYPQGRTREQVLQYLQSIADPSMGSSMLPRRISTILAWPRAIGFIRQTAEGSFQIQNNFTSALPIFEIKDDSQPLLPVTGALSEFQEIEQRNIKAREEVAYFKDQAKLDRATNAHSALVNLVAQRIRNNGGMPKSNQLIDLAVRFDHDYIFEMKSTNNDNIRAQVRKGMSQLYEYRYLQNKPNAKLILVIEKPFSASQSWMLDYMEVDREINVVWDGNNELYGSENTKRQIPFLGLLD
jgi:hypothetical protein